MPAELVPYTPFMGRFFPTGKTVIPAHLQSAYRYLFDALEEQLPFAKGVRRLQENLGFGNYADFSKRLTAEQADSLLLATLALSKGQAFTIADQTGVGKGRILAGIARFALTGNKKVVFISENHNLFVDFWRDLFDLQAHLMLPGKKVLMMGGKKIQIFHPQARSVYCQSPCTKQVAEWVAQKNTDFLCVMTTFSQLAGKAGQARLDYLCEFAKDAYVLMDESHNTIGASSGVREALERVALGMVYSSATMMNKAEHLRHILPRLNLDTDRLPENFISQLSGYESIYADFIGKTLVRNGAMMRREHSYQMPHTLSYADDATEEKIQQNLLDIGFFINSVLGLHVKLQLKFGAYADTPQHIQQLVQKTVSRFWKNNGSRISRLVRNVLLLNMVEFAVSRTQTHLDAGKKVALVLNSTLSSLIEELHRTQKAKGCRTFCFTLHKALYSFFNDFEEEFGKEIWQQPFFQQECKKLENIVAGIPNPPLSVIDTLKSRIAETTGQTVLEISGRENCVRTLSDGSHDWVKRSDEKDRNTVGDLFNNGGGGKDYDVIILTNAGSTGLSLHAGKTFGNQKQRHMIELEINPNTIEREQTHGRINRTEQVTLPTLETLMSRHLTALRLFNHESEKMTVARHLIASGRETADALLLSEPAEWAARHFLCQNPDVAERIPIKPNHVRADCTDFPVLNRLLSRAFYLEKDEHQQLRDMLCAAQENNRHAAQLHQTVRTLRYQDISQIKTSRLFSCGTFYDARPHQQMPVRDRLKAGTPELLLCRIDCHPKLNIGSLADEHDDYAAKRHTKPFAHIRFFAEKTIADEQERAMMKRNLALVQNLTFGDEVSFVLDGCDMKGVVVDVQTNEQYPYPEFQAIGLRLQPNSSDAVIVWENDVFLPLNYLVSNAALRLNALEELQPCLECSDGHRFYALLGHPLLQAWLLSVYQNKLGRGSFISDDGETHPMLILPKDKVEDLRNLFTEYEPLLYEEQLQSILYGRTQAQLCNADQSLSCTLTDRQRGIIRIEQDRLHQLVGEKARAKLAAYDAETVSYMGKTYWQYNTPASTLQSVLLSYFHSARSQLFVQMAT